MAKISRRDLMKAGPAVAALVTGGTPLLLSAEELAQEPRNVAPTGAFPKAGIDSFLSHFIIAIEVLQGSNAGQILNLALPSAVQHVARSEPFIYKGNHTVRVPLRANSKLTDSISEKSFAVRPPGFFRTGKQQVWLQILDLDAKHETPAGTIRITLGETFKKEHPDLFEPSLGVAESLGASGFPARLFFSPNAIVETPFGTFKTRAGKALVGTTIDAFPPIGSSPTLLQPVLLDTLESLRSAKDRSAKVRSVAFGSSDSSLALATPAARVAGLSHAIDAAVATAK